MIPCFLWCQHLRNVQCLWVSVYELMIVESFILAYIISMSLQQLKIRLVIWVPLGLLPVHRQGQTVIHSKHPSFCSVRGSYKVYFLSHWSNPISILYHSWYAWHTSNKSPCKYLIGLALCFLFQLSIDLSQEFSCQFNRWLSLIGGW